MATATATPKVHRSRPGERSLEPKRLEQDEAGEPGAGGATGRVESVVARDQRDRSLAPRPGSCGGDHRQGRSHHHGHGHQENNRDSGTRRQRAARGRIEVSSRDAIEREHTLRDRGERQHPQPDASLEECVGDQRSGRAAQTRRAQTVGQQSAAAQSPHPAESRSLPLPTRRCHNANALCQRAPELARRRTALHPPGC